MLRNKLLDLPTTRQSQKATAATEADFHNNQIYDAYIHTIQSNTKEQQQSDIKQKKLIVHYTHERRFSSFKRDLHHVYDTVFYNTPVVVIKMIVGNRNCRDTRHELIRKRPRAFLLKNTLRKR